MLAMTAKLGQMMTQMSWVPGDSSLVGLAQLSGEQQPDRLRQAVAAVFRVYLALATGGTCILLAVNGAFVSGWVGPHLFAGSGVNAVLAAIILVEHPRARHVGGRRGAGKAVARRPGGTVVRRRAGRHSRWCSGVGSA